MAVEIPVIVNIADGIDDAIKNQLPKAMREAKVAMSRESLALKFHIDDSNLTRVETILTDTKLKAENVARALREVNAEISKKKAGGAKFTGNNVSIKNRALLEAQTALQMKYDALSWTEANASKEAEKLANSQDKVDKSNKRVSKSTQEVNDNLKNSSNHLANLIKNSIRLIAVHSATRFIKNVREVTAEFEMQRVALAGIIQDTAEAESLFKKLKAAAIQSPFEIKDLVTFTKQLSAYRIETDKLFDVTMRLADISAGLGVDMNRLVLAYGQVRAASVLRGQELRQFTEAGIPLVELLAEKFTVLNGRMVSTADVFDLISKRAVPFKMIEEIFQDMTSAGGAFYNMQEKQSETLKGQWMKLKDAASIMYDEIGNTDVVHNAMETMLSDAMTLLQSWRKVSGVVGGIGVAFAINQFLSLIPGFTQKTTLAKKAVDGLATSLKSVGTWVGLAVTAISAIIGYFIQLRREANRLNNEINAARVKGDIQIEQSLRNFRRLADAAVSAAQGSAEQRDALKELQRTYGDIIPAQDLEIEKLRELRGNYELLTRAISEKIQMQVHEQNVNQIEDTYGNQIASIQKQIKKALVDDAGLSREEAGRYISAVMDAIRDNLISPLDDATDIFIKMRKIAAEQIGPDKDWQAAFALVESSNFWGKSYFSKLLKVVPQMNKALEEEDAYFKGLNNSLGKYSDMVKELRKNSQRVPEGFTLDQTGSFEYNQALWRQRLDDYKDALVKMFGDTDITDAFETAGTINFQKIIDKISNSKGTGILAAAVNELQKDYLNFAPQEKTTRLVTEAAIGFADSVGIAMTRVQGYLKKDGQQMDEYAKSVEDFVESQKLRVQTKEFEYKNWNLQADWVRPTEEDIQNEKDELKFLEKLLEFVREFLKTKTTGGSGQDPWIILYKNRMKFMQDFQKGVEDLDKYLSHSASLGREQEIMKGRGLSLGIDTDQLQGDAEELRKWYSDAIDQVVKKIQSMGGKQFAGLGVTEILAKDLTGRKIQKYQELLQELWKGLTDFDTNKMKKSIEESLESVKDKIERSETARNFYQDILGLTGDEDLATNMTVSVYGDVGEDFKDRIKKQLVDSLNSLDAQSLTGLDDAVRNAFNEGDYEYLVKNLDRVPEKLRDIVKQVASDAEKYNADVAKSYAKLLLKYDEMEQQRVNITNQASQDIKAIEEGLALELAAIAKKQISEEEKARLESEAKARANAAKGSVLRERDLQLSRLEREYRLFFSSVGVISDEAARKVAKNQKQMLTEQFNAGQKTLAQYKRELREIEEQLKKYENNRGVLVTYLTGGSDAVIDKLSEYSDSLLAIADASFNKENGTWVMNEDDKAYIDKMGQLFGGKLFGVSGRANAFDKLLKKTEGSADEMREAIEGASESIKEMGSGMSQGLGWAGFWVSLIGGAINSFDELAQHSKNSSGEVAEGWNNVANILMKIPTLGLSKDDDAWERFTSMNDRAMEGFEKFKSGNIIGALIDVVYSWVEMFDKSTRTIDRQIKEQSNLVDDLKYQYERLGVAIEKAFGQDYIYNYNKQMEVLQAQAEAYRKQAELERSKGKKADEETAKGYEKSARDIEDQMEDMRSQLSEFFAGTDVTSAATDFAQAWIEAYKQFGSTTDAMREKFQDMLQNMIQNSLAAKIMQSILQPLFDEIDEMAQSEDELSASEIAKIAADAPGYIDQINNAMTTLMSQLAASGYDVRQQMGQFTGISRNIAGASEESITGLAAGINTQNFYISHIDATVTAILSAMTGGSVVTNEGANGAVTNPYQTEMLMYAGHIPTIDQNLSELLSEVRKVIKPRGTAATHYVATNL